MADTGGCKDADVNAAKNQVLKHDRYMYEHISGRLKQSSPTHVVVETHGLGYRLYTPVSTWSKLPSIGSDVAFFLSLYVREDTYRLYGFLTQEERDLFERLTTLSGVGPKTALSLLGHLEFDALIQAIQQENLSLLCKIPGIGKKTAQRLLIELKGQKWMTETPLAAGAEETDALNALIHLGYTPSAAQKALAVARKEQGEGLPLSSLITSALGLLARS